MDWQPLRADHAIDRVSLIGSFASILDPNLLDELIVQLRKSAAKYELTVRAEGQQPLEFRPNPDGSPIEINPAQMRRVAFQRVTSDGLIVEEIALFAQGISLVTANYTRWNDFFGKFSQILLDLSSVGNEVKQLSKVRLEYIDGFLTPNLGADYFEVVNKTSKLLTPSILTAQQAFHVHSGWFDFDLPNCRRLTNVNVDVNDGPFAPNGSMAKKVSVLTLCQLEAVEGAIEDAEDRIQEMHTYLKLMLKNIITDDAAKRIGLGA